MAEPASTIRASFNYPCACVATLCPHSLARTCSFVRRLTTHIVHVSTGPADLQVLHIYGAPVEVLRIPDACFVVCQLLML